METAALAREVRGGTGRIARTRAVSDELAAAWLEAHETWFEGAQGRVVRVSTPLGDVVAKRERRTGWNGSLVRVGARRLRSPIAFRLGRELLRAGLATPEPLACVTSRGRAEPSACLITRYVKGSGPWGFLAGERAVAPAAAPRRDARPIPSPHPPGEVTPPGSRGCMETTVSVHPSALDELLVTLAGSLASLHAAGFRHRDLKEPNLLVRRGEDGSPEVFWTDLESLARPRAVTDAVRCRDLARLAMSFASARARRVGVRADAWPRFVRAYLEGARDCAPTGADVSRFLARTRRWSDRRIERNVLHGRPIA